MGNIINKNIRKKKKNMYIIVHKFIHIHLNVLDKIQKRPANNHILTNTRVYKLYVTCIDAM